MKCSAPIVGLCKSVWLGSDSRGRTRESFSSPVRWKLRSTARSIRGEPQWGAAMKPKDHQELFVRNRTNCRRVFCAFISPINIARGFSHDGSLSTGRTSVGGFAFSLVIAVMIVGVRLTAASACDVSHFGATAKNNSVRAMPAASVPELGFEGKTQSNPGDAVDFGFNSHSPDCAGHGLTVGGVHGNGQASYVSITELRVYGMDAQDQPKIAESEREVAGTE
jgi:hypothetical protein